jgi:hypothetical protein
MSDEAKSTHRLERDLSRKFRRETELEKSPGLTNCCSGSKKHCRELSLPCLSILGPVLQSYLGTETSHRVGAQCELSYSTQNFCSALSYGT